MAVACPETVSDDPDYITYLLTPDLCDCFFVVGNEDMGEPERIGVVRKMLLAHSVVLRSDLLATEIKEKKDIRVVDTSPNTFKNLLRFAYGYDNTGKLEFDEAGNLLYAAEKYQVVELKARVSARLMKLLTPNNICSLLNNPACRTALELDSAITRILQHETARVLACQQFLDLSSDQVVKVFEQSAMNVPEIEVWKAAVRWAKHRTHLNDGEILRKELEKPAKHIRICTIDHSSFFKDVVTTSILTDKEVFMVNLAKSFGQKQEELIYFSNEVACRTQYTSEFQKLNFGLSETSNRKDFELFLLTKKHDIELLPLVCKGMVSPYPLTPEGLTYDCNCTIKVTRVTDLATNTSSEEPETIELCQQVEYGKEFSVPLIREGKNLVLCSNNLYRLSLTFSKEVSSYCTEKKVKHFTFPNYYITVHAKKQNAYSLTDHCHFPSNFLYYHSLQ